jgi:hypothetical protein
MPLHIYVKYTVFSCPVFCSFSSEFKEHFGDVLYSKKKKNTHQNVALT